MSRLDAELVSRGIAKSRGRANEMIKSGGILVNGRISLKPSLEIAESDKIEAITEDLQYVGRGALKLEKAVKEFDIDLRGKICLDIGASTGGFTDFMLKSGALKVISVDVGHGQLADTLRSDIRVVNAEGTDIRDVTIDFIGGEVDFISADVSFISLKKILPKMYELLKKEACAAVLIKPQFEAGRENIGKRGVVKDKKIHERILNDVHSFAVSIGFCPEQYTYSPVKGGSGNIEYLVKLIKTDSPPGVHDFKHLVNDTFKQLQRSVN